MTFEDITVREVLVELGHTRQEKVKAEVLRCWPKLDQHLAHGNILKGHRVPFL